MTDNEIREIGRLAIQARHSLKTAELYVRTAGKLGIQGMNEPAQAMRSALDDIRRILQLTAPAAERAGQAEGDQ